MALGEGCLCVFHFVDTRIYQSAISCFDFNILRFFDIRWKHILIGVTGRIKNTTCPHQYSHSSACVWDF